MGYVYVLGNMAMPGLYKIGFTRVSAHTRADQLSAFTGVPHPFDVLVSVRCCNAKLIEAKIHEDLAEYRLTLNREFFAAGLDVIADSFERHGLAWSL